MPFKNGATKNLTAQLRLRDGVDVRTLSGALTLDATSGNYLLLDPGGAGRTVTLPAAAGSNGLAFFIANTADAAEDLTISDGSTVATVGQGQACVVASNGSDWYVVMPTIAQALAAGLVVVADGNFRIGDSADLTKRIAFEASGITAGQTRTITMPDRAINLGNVGQINLDLITGGAAGNHTLTGVTTADALIAVMYLVGAGTDVTDVLDLGGEFQITATNTIANAGGTNTTGGKMLVLWLDVA
jgi:hypothetical protein